MTYKEARVYLDKVSKYGSVLGLDTIRGLLRELGDPQDDLKFIHIAGTNGKGSVLAYTSTILSEAGYRIGRYVSPTVVSYLERIQVDGKWISEEMFAGLTENVQKAIARMEAAGQAIPTVFEVETAIAFLYFKKMNCDLVVLETGLGGSEDATNVIKNTVCAVFAPISRDHMGILGNTLEEITHIKAGIIKPGCAVISATQKPAVREILQAGAKENAALFYEVQAEQIEILEEGYRGQRFSYRDWTEVFTPLAGRNQLENAAVVLEVISVLVRAGYQISEKAIRAGFEKTRWPGRFSCLREEPVFIIDGAHNEDAAFRLRESIKAYFTGKKLIFIMGVFKDKEYEKIAEILCPLASSVYTVSLPDTGRTLRADELADIVRIFCPQVQAEPDIKEAVEHAIKEAKEKDVILAFGSLSYLGSVMELVSETRKAEKEDIGYD